MPQNLWNDMEKAPDLNALRTILDTAGFDTAALADVMTAALAAAVFIGYEPIAPAVEPVAVANSAPMAGIANDSEGSGESRRPGGVAGAEPLAFAANAAAEYAPLPFDRARQFWKAKRLVGDYSELEGKTWHEARVLGFKVAGITEKTVLRQIHTDLDAAVKGEKTVKEFVSEAKDKYGLGAKHAEIIVRTNVQSAYHWGHYRQLTDPAVQAEFPLWGFDVVMDGRTSDICRPLAGKAYRVNDPIWDSLYPPNHYNCRTTVVPLSEADAADMGFTIESAWPRDPETGASFMPQHGFEGNIGNVDLAYTLPDTSDVRLVDSVDEVMAAAAGTQKAITGTGWVDAAEATMLQDKGIQADLDGYEHMLTADAIRHIHTNHREVTDAMLRAYRQITGTAPTIEPGETEGGLPAIEYQIPAGAGAYWLIVEEIRKKSGVLALATFKRKKNRDA